MKKFLLILFLPFFTFSQSVSWSPFKLLPIGLRLSPAGIAVTIAKSLVSKRLGKFSVSTGFNLYKRGNMASPTYSSTGYSSSYNSNSNENYIVEDDDFTLIIRYGKEDFVYTISGYEELEVYTDGKTLFKVGKEKIIIDVTDSNLEKIEFRGKEIRGSKKKMLTDLENELGKVGFNDFIQISNFDSKGQAIVSFRVKSSINIRYALINSAFEVTMLLPYANIICKDGKTLNWYPDYSGLASRNFINISTSSIYKTCVIDFDAVGGLIPVSDGQKWGYIDKNNNTVLTFRYDDASNFSTITNTAIVKMKDNMFRINKQGNASY
jgi:WG containing repeat